MKPFEIPDAGCDRCSKLIVVSLVLILGLGVIGCQQRKKEGPETDAGRTLGASAEGTSTTARVSGDLQEGTAETSLPRLLDLGAGKCIPCKMMAPILEELREQYRGKLEVVFIDVWENRDAGRQYGIRLIPTQIFFDASGKEVFRHEGFISKEDILAKWDELGIHLQAENRESNNES